jgi:hypothetical protein
MLLERVNEMKVHLNIHLELTMVHTREEFEAERASLSLVVMVHFMKGLGKTTICGVTAV